MNRIALFLRANGIRQVDLARFLGISEPSVSKMCRGFSNPSEENLRKILNNDRGWDVAMLVDPDHACSVAERPEPEPEPESCGILRERIKCLERLLEEKERTIQILMKK